ncbi:hypothetical protein FPSE_10703 [Fusarium pseudograminearum CS3096]|uniref:Uncharacterized protein n=1 Tax=Fusarium pseudograminearum (strain CS3096) TaxID=1028729 RepID=K3V6U1_FUSPC|nr:hypothetical protein FPSE_10703 [Fusarium pseudograminearum CS3096]EKJ69122.1 hypothetical protein FPSE_10703 [Fusarium pseudograminearum CS3096]
MDIRTMYDTKGYELSVACHILECRYPTVTKDNARSALDCLIVVLRCIYSNFMFEHGGACHWIGAAEKKNHILRHAWSPFGPERSDVREDARDREQVLKLISGCDSSFESLCNSELMNEAFWSQNEFLLFEGLLGATDAKYVEASPTQFANQCLLKLDLLTDPTSTMEGVIKESFGRIPFCHQWVWSRPSRPWIIRVMYTPNVIMSRRLGINDLRTLRIPIWKQRESAETACWDEIGKSEYFLMAVVRLRDDRHTQDYVRTYNEFGANIVAENPSDTFVNNSWSLNDDGGKYMLFYGLDVCPGLDDRTRFPEVARPLFPDEDVDLIELSIKDSLKCKTSSDKPQMPRQEPSVHTGSPKQGVPPGSTQPTESSSGPPSTNPSKSARRRQRKREWREQARPSQTSTGSKPDASEISRDSRRSPN